MSDAVHIAGLETRTVLTAGQLLDHPDRQGPVAAALDPLEHPFSDPQDEFTNLAQRAVTLHGNPCQIALSRLGAAEKLASGHGECHQDMGIIKRVISCESVIPYSYLGFAVSSTGNNSTLRQAMINSGHVHIHQFKPDGAVLDAAALGQFQQQWATYGKLVSNNSLSHREVKDILHATLSERFTAPFDFLDIACGDASIMTEALHGVPVRHYHGIDLSQPALELAAANLAELPCEVDLDHRDFFKALARRTEHADVAWCSLSIHHLATDNKLDVLRAIHDALGRGGVFLLYEPTCGNGEDREAYLERFLQTNFRLWDYLSKPEWEQMWDHVSTCDFPEGADQWLELGRAAGFGSGRQVFADPTDFYHLFRFNV